MQKTLENVKDMLTDELKKLTKKGDITLDDLTVVKEILCSVKMIEELTEDDMSYSFGVSTTPAHVMPMGNRSPVTGRFVSKGTSYMGSYGDGIMRNHYSGHSINDRLVAALEPMYDEATSEHEKQVVSNWINRIRSEQ